MPIPIPLSKLSCHHCKQWHKKCSGIQYKNLNVTGDTYCVNIWGNYSEDSLDGVESAWLNE